jgi:multicomponent Na+:H+ antiporter subunit G
MMWLIQILVGAGLAFQALGALALHRFPDVYTRAHGTTKCTTFGSVLLYIGIILYSIPSLGGFEPSFAAHVVMLMPLVMLTNAAGAHAIARASHRSGNLPKGAVVDMLEEDRRKLHD